MSTSPTAPPSPSPLQSAIEGRRTQVVMSVIVALAVATTYVASAVLAHSTAVEAASAWLQRDVWQRTGGRYAYHPLSLDSGDYTLLRELPRLDLRQGGVTYIGSSTLQHSIVPWELPPAQASSVHNLAIESANFREQFAWVRYLVEQRGLGAGPPGQTMVVLGLSHLDSRDKLPGTKDSAFVDELFARYGLYDYDRTAGLADKPLNPITRFVREQKLLSRGMLQQLGSDIGDDIQVRWHGRPDAVMRTEAGLKAGQWAQMGGESGWRSAIEHQVGYLDQMIDYLQRHGIRVAAVFVPMKRFNADQPFAPAFQAAARELCQRRGVALTDLSRAAAEDEFADGSHLGYKGQHRISEQALVPALTFLRETGQIDR